MNDLRHLLREGDPLRNEPHLAAADVERIRRMVRATGPARRSCSWALPAAVVAVATLALVVVVWDRGPRPIPSRPTAEAVPATPAVERRQIQFSTPGGTRVYWTLDSTFHVR